MGKASGFDCVAIPGAINPTMTSMQAKVGPFCGRDKGIQAKATSSATAGTVCSK